MPLSEQPASTRVTDGAHAENEGNAKQVIYNLEHFIEDLPEHMLPPIHKFPPNAIEGAPISLDEETPISYVIGLPEGEIKGIYVEAYGGMNKDYKQYSIQMPDVVQRDQLLANGIAVVKLNLVDLLTDYPLFGMDETLHNKIHQSINKVYETLRDNPESLHPSLEGFRDKPIGFYGTSFGGRTAVKHAELFPNTFDCYFSGAGALSMEMHRKSDSHILSGRNSFEEALAFDKWGDAMNDIHKIEKPIVLFQNVDDNNVSLKVMLDWYKAAIAAGKRDLIRMIITDKGISEAFPMQMHGGHVMSGNANDIARIIINGPSTLPEYSDWLGHKYEIIANLNYRSASVEEMFVAQSYRQYKKGNKKMLSENTLDDNYYAVNYLNKSDNNSLFEDVRKMDSEGLLTDEVLSQALKSHLKLFLGYVGINSAELDMNNLITPELLLEYKKSLLSDFKQPPSPMVLFDLPVKELRYSPMITSLFIENPSLLSNKINEYLNDEALQQNLVKAKNEFKTVVNKEKALIRETFRAIMIGQLPEDSQKLIKKKLADKKMVSEIRKMGRDSLEKKRQETRKDFTPLETVRNRVEKVEKSKKIVKDKDNKKGPNL